MKCQSVYRLSKYFRGILNAILLFFVSLYPMIHFYTIQDITDAYWTEFIDTYTSSFPVEEQRPIDSIISLILKEKRFKAMILLNESNHFIGFITTWKFASFIYIEHFALSSVYRSRGYGSQALRSFIQKNSLPIVLEVEPPIDAFSQRRIRFYERCGFTVYNYDYTQPPYTPDLSSVSLRLMGTLPMTLSVEHVASTLHQEVYKVIETN